LVTTGKAKAKIRSSLKEERRKQGEYGKEALERKFKHLKVNNYEEAFDLLVKYFQYSSHVDLFFDIATEELTIAEIFKIFTVEGGKLVVIPEVKVEEDGDGPQDSIAKRIRLKKITGKTILLINGEPSDRYEFTFATCCNPVQGDDIFAYLTANAGLKIHRTSCPNADNIMVNYGYRVMKAEWVSTSDAFFVADLVITGIDDGPGIIQRLTFEISNLMGLNIRSFNMSGEGGYFEGRVSLLVKNTEQLQRVIHHLENLESISTVRRITNN
jgi:GTP pyrophosphokinase